MAEMIIPGTYIDVRAEGLISAGGVATGIVGVVGTARSGRVGVPVVLSGFAQARDLYGLPDDFQSPADGSNPLTLVRALQLAYANGASTVVAVRVAGTSASAATFALKDSSGLTVASLAAATTGTWGNDIQVSTAPAKTPGRIAGEKQTSGFSALSYPSVLPSPQNRIQVQRGDTRRTDNFDVVYRSVVTAEKVSKNSAKTFQLACFPVAQVANINSIAILDDAGKTVRLYGAAPAGATTGNIIYPVATQPALNEVRINVTTGELTFEPTQVPGSGQTVVATYAVDHDAPGPGEVLVTTWNGNIDFAAGKAPRNGDTLVASYLIEPSTCVQVTLAIGQNKETYVVPDGRSLAVQSVNSQLATVVADAANGGRKPASDVAAFFGTGSNLGGSDGADAGETEYGTGLEALADQLVNIVVLAGQDSKKMGSTLLGHLKSTEETDFERIGVIGAPGSTVAEFLGQNLVDGRVVVVGPGILQTDGSTLPPAYTAAAVAGLISSLPVQTSLTNKPLNVPDIAVKANRGQQVQLIERNVLSIVAKEGLRVLKGVTSAGVGDPFSAIPTRRIVDYAKYGVRSAANPYLGRLNNSRVRGALKATLDAFLTGMVQDEALTGYSLDVSATRAQEIAGQVSVAMTIQPTFSIDFIRVVMTLQ